MLCSLFELAGFAAGIDFQVARVGDSNEPNSSELLGADALQPPPKSTGHIQTILLTALPESLVSKAMIRFNLPRSPRELGEYDFRLLPLAGLYLCAAIANRRETINKGNLMKYVFTLVFCLALALPASAT